MDKGRVLVWYWDKDVGKNFGVKGNLLQKQRF